METKNPLTRDQALDDANNDKDNSVEKDNSMEKNHPNVIEIDKAIIVSDLHLGYGKCNASAFTDFLNNCISNGISKEYSLFILGDLWDLWRKHDKGRLSTIEQMTRITESNEPFKSIFYFCVVYSYLFYIRIKYLRKI